MQRAAFSRFSQLMAVVGAALASGAYLTRGEALAAHGGYRSRGKGIGFHFSQSNGSARVKRAAAKARNQRRHRAASR